MPVRKIGLQYRSVGGRVPMGPGRLPVAVESTLERDFALLQRFDPEVASVEEQPVRIEYNDDGGRRRSYVPDFLVSYRAADRAPMLVEVKYSSDPDLRAGAFEQRFAAARHRAGQSGWTFALVTEVEIRTPRLENATFLLPFRHRTPDRDVRAHLVKVLGGGAPIAIQALVDAVACATGIDRVQVLPTLWSMVAVFDVMADLDRPLTMRSSLHLPEKGQP